MSEKEYKMIYNIQFADNGLICNFPSNEMLEVVSYGEGRSDQSNPNIIHYLGENLADDLFTAWDNAPEYDKFEISVIIKPRDNE